VTPRLTSRSAWLPRFSLDRRITVLVLLATAIVVGTVAVMGIPLELIPRGFRGSSLSVRVPWQDAPPQEVLDKIVLPLEEELSTVKGLDNMTSLAFTGNGRVYMSFKQGTDMDVAYREVRDRIERARRLFPDDVEQVFIHKDDASGIPVYVIGVAVDPAITDSYGLIENEILMPLERIDGVASVGADGLEEKEVLIELDRDRTEAAGLNIYELAMQLSGDNFTLASGTVRDGSRKLLLRSVARYRSLEELENRPVTPTVRLRDIGRVRFEEPEKNYRVRAMSKPAYGIVVFKEGDANAREVSRRVDAVFEEIQANPRLSGLEMIRIFSQGEVIEDSLKTLLQSGMIGGMVALLVLYFFLRRLRLTLLINLSIPLSLLISLTVMYFAGETLNLLSLLALMISVGLLVDNSVVVAENIHRMYRGGLERREACIQGASEIGLAITLSTLTTIVVFLPVALVEGEGQFWLIRLALPISVALLASLFVALVLIPLGVHLTVGEEKGNGNGRLLPRMRRRVVGGLRRLYEQSFGRLGRRYGRLLELFLRRRLDLVIGLLVVAALTIGLGMKQVKVVGQQEEERAGFSIEVTMPDETTLEETEEWFLEAEKIVEEHQEELGLEGWFLFHRKTFGVLQGWFETPRSVDLSPREVTERVIELLPEKAGVEIHTGTESEAREETGQEVHVVSVVGEDYRVLDRVAEELGKMLLRVDGVIGMRRASDQAPNELGLVLDRERAQRYGVNPQVVAGVVGFALRGMALPRYIHEGREVPVRVRFEEGDRESLGDLSSFWVPAGEGAFLPIDALTDVQMLASPQYILRRDKKTSRTVTLELEEDREEETRERIEAILAGVDLPEGVGFGASAAQIRQDEELAGMIFALKLSILFIYLLMGFLFESFVLPLSIILTIPLAGVGVVWSHVLFNRDMDFLGFVGMVLLVGVVVNNGIVLIDYVNRLRTEGRSRSEALRLATERRFRPIMMTALTTVGGMVPLALAKQSSIGLSYTSFSLTLIGGMTTATLLTLLVVPVFYTFFDDVREWFLSALRRVARRREPAAEEAGGGAVP
jgi:HAE1 family hydrophobic/amphiphilic exporter-1